jgi:hypothetical protein
MNPPRISFRVTEPHSDTGHGLPGPARDRAAPVGS